MGLRTLDPFQQAPASAPAVSIPAPAPAPVQFQLGLLGPSLDHDFDSPLSFSASPAPGRPSASRLASSFYVNCDFFGTGSNPTGNYEERAERMTAKYEFERIKKLHEVTKPEPSRLEESGEGLPEGVSLAPATKTPSMRDAAQLCAQDDLCKAVCRSEKDGETHVLRGFIHGYKAHKAQTPWRCLAFEGEEPFSFDDVQTCFKGLDKVTNGTWSGDQIIRTHLPGKAPGDAPEVIMLEPGAAQTSSANTAATATTPAAATTTTTATTTAAPATATTNEGGSAAAPATTTTTATNEGGAAATTEAQAGGADSNTLGTWDLANYASGLEQRFADSLESAQAQCTASEGCQAVCYHKDTGRTLFYGNIGDAEPKVESWKELLEPASSAEAWLGKPPEEKKSWFAKKEEPKSYSEGWQCSLSEPSCLSDEKLKQHHLRTAERAVRLDERREHRLQLAALDAPSGNAPVRLGPALGVDFWGQLKNVVGKEAEQWTKDCSALAPLLAKAKLDSKNYPKICTGGTTYIRRRYGYWLQCCGDSKTASMTCKPMIEDARTDCGGKVCGPSSVCLKEAPKKGEMKAKVGNCVSLGRLGEAKSFSGQMFEVTAGLSADALLALFALSTAPGGERRPIPRAVDHSSWRSFL